MSIPSAYRGDIVRLLCSLWFTLALALPAHAQAQDPNGPSPFSGAVETGTLGEPQLVEADVGEGVELASIVLRYRFDGVGDYRTLPMQATERPGIYAVSVPTRDVRAQFMEFFVVAETVADGRLLKGSESAPVVRELLPPAYDAGAPAAPEAPIVAGTPPVGDAPEPATSGGRKYLYYVLGALAVGALAAAAGSGGGGDGGGSSDEPCDAAGCNVRLVLPVP